MVKIVVEKTGKIGAVLVFLITLVSMSMAIHRMDQQNISYDVCGQPK